MPSSQPRVAISVWGRFHLFDLARELHRRDRLAGLITSYPSLTAKRFDLATANFIGLGTSEYLARAARRLPRIDAALEINLKARRNFERRARRAFNRLDADILVCSSGSSLSLIREAKQRGIPSVLDRGSAHIIEQMQILDDEHRRWGEGFAKPPAAHIQRSVQEYEEADFISVPSQFVYDSFLRQGVPARKLLKNPYGADLEAFSERPKAHQGFRVIQVGAVSLQKGFSTTIEAFQRAAIPDSELWFVGSLTDGANRYISKNHDPRVRYVGAVPQSELPDYYNQCDVACLGSVQEGLAMVLLQAAACGLPIVATDASGAPEVVGEEAGIVVPTKSPDRMAQALRALASDESRRLRMGRAARSRVEAEFGWQHYAARALKQYDAVVARDRVAP